MIFIHSFIQLLLLFILFMIRIVLKYMNDNLYQNIIKRYLWRIKLNGLFFKKKEPMWARGELQ